MKSNLKSQNTILMNGNKLKSGDLFSKSNEVLITHGEEEYKLRLTSNNKLILTK
ncbi:MAG: hemin uptake protein HemP [Rickettsiales bacterium]|jgi:hemin uptake protein HemP